MSPEEYVRVWPDSGILRGTELTLALPGTPIKASDGRKKCGNKRRFLETVDLKLGEGQYVNKYNSGITKYGIYILFVILLHVFITCISFIDLDLGVCFCSGFSDRLVGWPPVKKARRKYVKVAVDGAAYLRKVDLEMYDCYGQLLTTLENMFQGVITICK